MIRRCGECGEVAAEADARYCIACGGRVVDAPELVVEQGLRDTDPVDPADPVERPAPSRSIPADSLAHDSRADAPPSDLPALPLPVPVRRRMPSWSMDDEVPMTFVIAAVVVLLLLVLALLLLG